MLSRIAIPIVILLTGWLGYTLLSQKEKQKKKPQREKTLLRTEAIELHRQDFQTVVLSQGTIQPHNEAVLSSLVPGKVIEISPQLQDGSFFEKGDALVKLATEDFEAEIISANATLARAEANFAQEQTKANQARLNWEDLGYEEEPNELVLRLPQLREAEANVAAARAALEGAKRDLERTTVRAPFAGRVLERSVNIGPIHLPEHDVGIRLQH